MDYHLSIVSPGQPSLPSPHSNPSSSRQCQPTMIIVTSRDDNLSTEIYSSRKSTMSREIIYTLHVYMKHVVHNSIQPATHIIGHDKCLRRQQATLPQGLEDPGCCNWIRLTGKQSINMTLTVAGDAARRSAIITRKLCYSKDDRAMRAI